MKKKRVKVHARMKKVIKYLKSAQRPIMGFTIAKTLN